MKRNFHCLILLMALTVLTGCETAKYAFDQTFGDQKEFGVFQNHPAPHPDDIMLANADDWIREHLW